MLPHTRRVVAAVALLAGANVLCHGLRRSAVAPSVQPAWPDLPDAVGRWRGTPLAVSERIYDYLAPDKLATKAYRHGAEQVRAAAICSADWRAVHSPASCFTAAGYTVVQQRSRSVALPGGAAGTPLPAKELVAMRGNKRVAALYTFLTPSGATDSWLQQCWRMAVSGRGRGGMLVLLSAEVRHSPEHTHQLLAGLLADLYVNLAQSWPSPDTT